MSAAAKEASQIAIAFAIPPAFVLTLIYAPIVLVVLFVLLAWFGLSALIICTWFGGAA